MIDIHHEWEQVVDSLKDAEGFVFSIGFSPVTRAMLANSQKTRGVTDHIDAKDTTVFTVMLSPTWKSSADDERIHQGIDRILTRCWAMTNEKGLLHRSIFSTHAYYEGNVFQEHGEKGLAMLQANSQIEESNALRRPATPGGSKLTRPV
jgi:hypothetical protein